MGTKGTVAALLVVLWPASLHAEGSQPWVAVYYPGQSWYLRYELDGVLEEYNNHKPGHSTYAVARSETTGMLASAQIHPADKAKTAVECRDHEYARLRKNKDFGNPQVRFSEAAGADMEVLMQVGSGISRHLHRYWLRAGLCAKIHASKTPFAERDRPAFEKLVDSARLEPATANFERAFVIPGRGTLLVSVPAAWGFRTGRPGRAMPRELSFMEPSGEHQVMLTVFPEPDQILKGERTARGFVARALDAARPKALEADPPLLELKGRSGSGFYFSVTDRDLVGKPAGPNDWKYLRQGALLVGEALLFFSIFSNAKDSPAIDSALAGISQARFD